MGRILGLDWGKKLIGLAISDELKISAQPFVVLEFNDKILKELKKICKEKNVEKIVIGLPMTLKGEIGKQAKEVLDFSKKCRKEVKIPIIFEDERFSSRIIRELFKKQKVNKKRQKKIKNIIEAQVILQSYLERLKQNENNF